MTKGIADRFTNDLNTEDCIRRIEYTKPNKNRRIEGALAIDFFA